MKQTKIMLAVIASLLLTWMSFGLIGYLLSDATYKECMTHGAMLFFMMTFGWIPSAIIGNDLDNNFNS